MLPWNNRPVEIANLFNPALCAALLHHSFRGFKSERDLGMPYSLTFLVLPIVLHRTTRNQLPRSISTRMHVWLQNNPEARINFAQRAENLVPYTKEAIIFGINSKIFSIQDDGKFHWTARSLREPSDNSELLMLVRKSRFIGRWFAQLSEPSSIFTMWGVRP